MERDPRLDTVCPLCLENVSLDAEDTDRFCFKCSKCDTQFDIIKVTDVDTGPQRMGPFLNREVALAAKFAGQHVLSAWGNDEMSFGEPIYFGGLWYVEFNDKCNDDKVIEFKR